MAHHLWSGMPAYGPQSDSSALCISVWPGAMHRRSYHHIVDRLTPPGMECMDLGVANWSLVCVTACQIDTRLNTNCLEIIEQARTFGIYFFFINIFSLFYIKKGKKRGCRKCVIAGTKFFARVTAARKQHKLESVTSTWLSNIPAGYSWLDCIKHWNHVITFTKLYLLA